jgi:hypothetical protein
MCSCTHLVFLAHLLGLAAGVMFIRELVRLRVPAWMLAAGTGAAALVMAAFVFHVSNPLQYFADFHKAYWPAGAAIWNGPGALEQVLRAGAFGFVNMPVVAYLFAPFGLLPPHVSALVFLVLSVATTIVAWRLLVGAAGLDESAKWTLAFLIAAFGPLLYSIREGNTTHMVLALLVWAFLLLRERRDLAAGAVLGFAALIKLPLLLFGIYYMLRGRWQVVAGGAGLLGLASLFSLAIFGWDMHVFWYETCIKPYAEAPIGALNVQSIAGALLRLEYGPQFILDWERHQLSPALRIIASASTFVLLGLAAAAALAPRPRASRLVARETAEELEFLIVLMLACIASPLTWSHYYTWMLMPAAFFIGRTPHFPPGPVVRVVGWGAIVLASIPVTLWMPGNPLVAEIYARLVVSQLLFGGLVMLGLLMWSRWTMRSEVDAVVVRAGAPAPA